MLGLQDTIRRTSLQEQKKIPKQLEVNSEFNVCSSLGNQHTPLPSFKAPKRTDVQGKALPSEESVREHLAIYLCHLLKSKNYVFRVSRSLQTQILPGKPERPGLIIQHWHLLASAHASQTKTSYCSVGNFTNMSIQQPQPPHPAGLVLAALFCWCCVWTLCDISVFSASDRHKQRLTKAVWTA